MPAIKLKDSPDAKILIRAANWIGDAVMTTPVIRAVRKNYPKARIHVLAKPWVIPVYENNPHVDEIIEYQASSRHTRGLGTFRLGYDLRVYRFDLALLLQNAFEAALVAFWAKIPERLGYNTDARGFLLNRCVKLDPALKKTHLINYYLGILQGAELDCDGTAMDLVLDPADTIFAEKFLIDQNIDSSLPVIGINPGATGGTAKRWFPERYAQICQKLHNRYGNKVLIFGGPADRDLGDEIRSLSKGTCINIAGSTTLGQAFALIQSLDLFVTNDSGLMHAAAAFDTPQVAVIGSTDFVATSPHSPASLMVRVPVECSPCLKDTCPIDHRCMDRITVDMVMENCQSILDLKKKLGLANGKGDFALFEHVKRILIVKPSSLGDIVHSLPFLDAVAKQFPGAQIDWVVAHGLHTFLEDHPLINRLWIIKKDQWKKIGRLKTSLKEIMALKSSLARQNYDVCIDLSGLLRSGLISWFSKADIRLGFKESDEGSPFFYTHKIHGSMSIHAIDRYLEIARFMGCDIGNVRYPFTPFDENPGILEQLPENYAVISPSAGKPANRWPAERFGKLAAGLPIPSVIIASRAEADIAATVEEYSRGNALSIAGKTSLKELCAIIKKAKFFICNDTGPMHIAAAFDVPVFAIFGPANPIRTGPYGQGHTVIQKQMDCSPCYAKTPCTRFEFRCMNGLTVQHVTDVINKKIGEGM